MRKRLLLGLTLLVSSVAMTTPAEAAGPALSVRYYKDGVLANGGILNVGTTQTGTSFRFFLTLANNGDATLNVGTIVLPAGFSFHFGDISGSTIAAGATLPLWLNCDAASTAVFTGTLIIPTDDPLNDPFEATLTCAATSGSGDPGMVLRDDDGVAIPDGTGEMNVLTGTGEIVWVYNEGGFATFLSLQQPTSTPVALDFGNLVAESGIPYEGIPSYFYVNCKVEEAPVLGDYTVKVPVNSWEDYYTFTVHCVETLPNEDGGSLADNPTGSGLTLWGSALAAMLLAAGGALWMTSRRRPAVR